MELAHFHGFLKSLSATTASRGWVPRLMSENFMCCHAETGQGDNDFCLSQSDYTDTEPINRERVPGVGIEPTTS